MIDILLVSSVVQMLYPFIALYAWYKVSKHNRIMKAKAEEREHRINGRMDELIDAKVKIAHEEGRKIGIAEGILIGQRG